MSWQDAVFGAGQLAFSLALIPSILGPHKPAAATSSTTAAVLLGFCGAYASLGLWAGAASCGLCAAGWLALWAQKMAESGRESSETTRLSIASAELVDGRESLGPCHACGCAILFGEPSGVHARYGLLWHGQCFDRAYPDWSTEFPTRERAAADKWRLKT